LSDAPLVNRHFADLDAPETAQPATLRAHTRFQRWPATD